MYGKSTDGVFVQCAGGVGWLLTILFNSLMQLNVMLNTKKKPTFSDSETG